MEHFVVLRKKSQEWYDYKKIYNKKYTALSKYKVDNSESTGSRVRKRQHMGSRQKYKKTGSTGEKLSMRIIKGGVIF